MDTTGPIDLAMVIMRGIVLIIAALGGVISIYLGWRLYRENKASAVSTSVEKDSWKFRMRAAGPGVFFALFGMLILSYIVYQQIKIQFEEAVQVEQPDVEESGQPLNAALLTGDATPAVLMASQSTIRPAQPCRPATPPRHVCLVRRQIRVMSGGDDLSEARVRGTLATATRLLQRLDRALLSLADRAALDGALDTFDEILASTGTWPAP